MEKASVRIAGNGSLCVCMYVYTLVHVCTYMYVPVRVPFWRHWPSYPLVVPAAIYLLFILPFVTKGWRLSKQAESHGMRFPWHGLNWLFPFPKIHNPLLLFNSLSKVFNLGDSPVAVTGIKYTLTSLYYCLHSVSCKRLQTDSSNICQQPCVSLSHCQVYLVKQSGALFQSTLLIFDSLHLVQLSEKNSACKHIAYMCEAYMWQLTTFLKKP